MATPFGTVYAGNLTPDDVTGLGRWSADDFWRAMHEGRSKDGSFQYPAMPYTNYTKVTREDSDAIYAYLMTLAPVAAPNRAHELRFPYNQRELLAQRWQVHARKVGMARARRAITTTMAARYSSQSGCSPEMPR